MIVRGKRAAALVLLICISFTAAACAARQTEPAFDPDSVRTYRDIPNITEYEIDAIEKLKSGRESFSYGCLLTSDAFFLPDGTSAGFTSLFCELLSELFEIPFIMEIHSWDNFIDELTGLSIDFTGDLTPTPERRQTLKMTSPISQRSLSAFFLEGDVAIRATEDLQGLRIGFARGTITADSVRITYPSLDFIAIEVLNPDDAAEKLLSGDIDVFIDESVLSVGYFHIERLASVNVLPLVFTPISLATANPSLDPIISAVDKYLEAGGIVKTHRLYQAGAREYAAFRLSQTFTPSQKSYIDRLAGTGQKVPVALEHDNYPVCFWNERDGEFQGIAPDVLGEISLLTGIEFEIVTKKDTQWELVIDMLRTGEAALVSQLMYSEQRTGLFIWPENSYYSSNIAFLSRSDYQNLEFYQIPLSIVGIVRESAFEDILESWFPGDTRKLLFATQDEALDALEAGRIDLLLATDYILLYQTHFREKTGLKINILIDEPKAESSFGFNVREEVLCSIIDQAQNYINTDGISREWLGRVYDYSRRMAEDQVFYLTVFLSIIAVMMVAMVVLFLRNNRTRVMYKNQLMTLSTIYDTVPDMMLCKDMNLAYTNCNRRFAEFAGSPESELIGKTVHDVESLTGRVSDEVSVTDREVLEKRTISRVQSQYTYPDGRRIMAEIIKSPLIRGGKLTGLLTVIRDITELKTAMDDLLRTSAQLEEALKVKNDFLAKMSHEIRTPMNAIIGMTELALREELPGAAREHVLTAKQAGVNLLAIINDLLDFSKIESGAMRINHAEYALSSLLNDVISIIRMRVIDSRLRFAVNLDSNLPNSLFGDEPRIRQVLINILGNAVKYTDKGFVYFRVGGEMIDEDLINLRIEVEDSGRGIKAEHIDRLFDNYFQIESVSSDGAEGVGLGLPITRNILNAMGGNITVESEYGRGSTFTVILPQKIGRFQKLAVVEEPAKANALVYERREIYAESIVYTIRNLGVKCKLVSNRSEFFSRIASGAYSFVFMSYILYDQFKETILKYSGKCKIVLLTEFGQALPSVNLHILSMPAHVISVANLFNGNADSYAYSTGTESIVRFTAPDANVLVVDDISTNLKVISGLMAPYKMSVDMCAGGEDAIKAVASKNYDLVFMDHRMPDVDGVEATRRIRYMGNSDPRCKDLPIIALTANAVAGMKEMFLANGFNGFLPKPVDTVKLNSILEKWIPGEKQQAASEDGFGPPDEEDSPPFTVVSIEGLNTDTGIRMSGGDAGFYNETLAIYCDDALLRIGKIRECLEKRDFELYVTYVHALKSASANVGAEKLSAAAYDLEMAGLRRDMPFIITHNEKFLTELNTLITGVSAALEANSAALAANSAANAALGDYGDDLQQEPLDAERLVAELAKLRIALEDMTAGAIDRSLANLTAAARTEADRAAVKKISKHILMGEYEDAIAMVGTVGCQGDGRVSGGRFS